MWICTALSLFLLTKLKLIKSSKDTVGIAHRFSCLGIQEDEHEAIGELLVKDSLGGKKKKDVIENSNV